MKIALSYITEESAANAMECLFDESDPPRRKQGRTITFSTDDARQARKITEYVIFDLASHDTDRRLANCTITP